MAKNVSYKITWMTFVANIFILLEHAHIGDRISNTPIGYVMDFFSYMSIPIMGWFFFISAYLFFRNVESFGGIKTRLKNRIYTLLIPYMIWNTAGMVLHLMDGDFKDNLSFWNVFRYSYLFFSGEGCADGPLWYIARLFTFFLITPLIYFIIKRCNIKLFISIEIILIIVNEYFKTNNYDYIFFLPFFLMGAYFGCNIPGKFETWISGSNNKYLLMFFSVILISITYIRVLFSFPGLMIIYRIISLGIILLILRFMGNVKQPNELVCGIGMFLYCSHDIAYRVIRTLLYNISIDNNSILQIMIIFISFVIMLVVWICMKKFTPRILNIISGGRSDRKIILS